MVVKFLWIFKQILDESPSFQCLEGKVVCAFLVAEVFVKHLAVPVEAFAVWNKDRVLVPSHAIDSSRVNFRDSWIKTNPNLTA